MHSVVFGKKNYYTGKGDYFFSLKSAKIPFNAVRRQRLWLSEIGHMDVVLNKNIRACESLPSTKRQLVEIVLCTATFCPLTLAVTLFSRFNHYFIIAGEVSFSSFLSFLKFFLEGEGNFFSIDVFFSIGCTCFICHPPQTKWISLMYVQFFFSK